VPSLAIVYYSKEGHTHQVAEAVAEGARAVAGVSVELVRLQDADIQNGRWKNDAQLATLSASDGIVFGTPTYMGGYSAQMKALIDAASGIWYQQGWKDKLAAGFTHSSGLSGDKQATLQGLWVNAMQHSMVWVSAGQMSEGPAPDKVNRLTSFGGVMAQSDQGQATIHPGDRATAVKYGTRVGEAVVRWVKGKAG
jgi:NAD(P)H dehydrogenase (quinone)